MARPVFFFVVVVDLLRGEGAADGDFAVEVVGVGGAEAGDAAAGLGEDGGVGAVGVADGADGGPGAVEFEVGFGIGGGVECPFGDVAFEVDEDDVGGCDGGVVHAAGFDGEDAGVAVDGGDVAPGELDEAGGWEGAVGVGDLGSEGVEHGGGWVARRSAAVGGER